MSDISINVGIYGTGAVKHWDVNADKNTVAGSNQKADDAVNSAKTHAGAEVVTIDAAGNAGVHSLTVENGTFFHPPKSGTLTVDNVVVSASRSKNDNKPLAIDPSIAGKLGGQNALLVDEKNRVAFIGGDQNVAADAYLNNPDQKKVAAAYTIAGDDHVNKKMASNTLGALASDFRGNLTKASNNIGLLKPGQVKDKMQGLIAELGNVDKKAKDLDSQIIAPKERLSMANNNWNKADADEKGKINNASENLRESKFPGIHQAEDDLGAATSSLQNAGGNQAKAEQRLSQAQAKLSALDQIPAQVSTLKQQQESLKLDNANLLNNFNIALLQKKTDLIWTSADLLSKASRLDSDARREESKPIAPANTGGGSVTSDPFSSSGKISRQDADRIAAQISGGDGWVSKEDLSKSGYTELLDGPKRDQVAGTDNKISAQEFSDALVSGTIKAKGSSSGSSNSVNSDPFSNGNSGHSGSVTDDPFAQGNSNSYRDQSKVDRLKRAASGMRSDASELKMRATRIDQLFVAVNVTRDLSSTAVVNAVQNMDRTYKYGYSEYSDVFGNTEFGSAYKGHTYFVADTNDKLAIWNNYIEPTKSNNNAINNKGQQATQLQNKYYAEHPQAVQELTRAQDAQKDANAGVGYATAQVQQRQGKVDQINSSPLPDSNANVKKSQKALDSAIAHKETVVGENAPLTTEKNSALKAYNDLVEKIRTNNGGAQSLITNTKNALGI